MSSFENSTLDSTNLAISGHALNHQLQTIQVDNQYIRLRSKLWQVLEHLVRNRNQLVSRESIIDICWNGNSYTGEQGLTHTVCHLRRIFKKFNIEAQITTIPKRGYVLQEIDMSYNSSEINIFPYGKTQSIKQEVSSSIESLGRLG